MARDYVAEASAAAVLAEILEEVPEERRQAVWEVAMTLLGWRPAAQVAPAQPNEPRSPRRPDSRCKPISLPDDNGPWSLADLHAANPDRKEGALSEALRRACLAGSLVRLERGRYGRGQGGGS